MLVGVVAFNVLRVLDVSDSRALGVLLTGYFFQGMLLHRYHFSPLIVHFWRFGFLHDLLLSVHLCDSVSGASFLLFEISCLTSFAAWSISCSARTSFGFVNSCLSENLETEHGGYYAFSSLQIVYSAPMKWMAVQSEKHERPRQEWVRKLETAHICVFRVRHNRIVVLILSSEGSARSISTIAHSVRRWPFEWTWRILTSLQCVSIWIKQWLFRFIAARVVWMRNTRNNIAKEEARSRFVRSWWRRSRLNLVTDIREQSGRKVKRGYNINSALACGRRTERKVSRVPPIERESMVLEFRFQV